MNNLLNLKSFFKFLSQNKAYTAIDIFGLSVSLMFVILIAVYTGQELSVDKFQEKGDRIYVLGSDNGLGSAYKLAYRVEERFPEVEKVCPMNFYEHIPATIGYDKWNIDLMFADSTFFDFFSFDLVQGDKRRALETKGNAVISEMFARKVFGNENPLGKTIQLQDSLFVTVEAVMKDIRYSVLPYCDVLIRMDNIVNYNSSLVSETFDNASGSVLFLMEKEGARLKDREADMHTFFQEIFWIYKRGVWKDVMLIPLSDVYFFDTSYHQFLQYGDRKFVLILLSIGILILLFAVINYVNLTVAQTGFRAKEMATRRLLGSSREMLFARLIMESTLLSFLSLGIGLLLAYACVPFANTLLETKIYLTDAITPLSVFCVLIVTMLLGFLSGLLPAIIISNAKPIDVVRGSFRQKTKMVFSKVFITFQQVITIALVATSLTMMLQISYLIKAPLGYTTANIIDIPISRLGGKQQQITLGNELKQLASVKGIAFSAGTPFNRGNNWTFEYEGRNISMQILVGERAMLDMFGFQVVRDNHVVGAERIIYLTEHAMKEFNLPPDAESVKIGEQTTPISGIVSDFQLRNITQKKEVTALHVQKIEDFYPWNVLVEITGDPYTAMNDVRAAYERVTQLEFDGKFIDQQVEETFASQKRLVKIVIVFGVIAVLISLLGLLAMSTYFIQQRYREIGVRKVFGSSNREVLTKLVGTFLVYVLVGFVIATPIVWFIMNDWLSGYSYRISLSPLIFLAAGAFCFLISFLTVYWQSYQAATENPVKSIKSE